MAKHEKPPRYDTVIWDWDDTLGMTLEEWVNGYAKVFAAPSPNNPEGSRIYATRQELIDSMGSFRRRIHEYWEQSSEIADQLVAEAHALVAPRLAEVQLYPNAKNTVLHLGDLGIRQAVATKSEREVVESAALFNNIHSALGAFVGGNEIDENKQKPHPESVKLAHRRLRVSMGLVRAVIIGDSLTDLEMAKKAGLDSILYFPPENREFYDLDKLKTGNPTYTIENLEEVVDIITPKI